MKVPQLPLVLDNDFNNVSKTSEAVAVLKRFGCYEDVQRVIDNKKYRVGRSKVRGRRYQVRKGPLVVVNDDSESLVRALRNIPGVDTVNVKRLNIRLLAPGGQLGRLTLYTQGALQELSKQFGSHKGFAEAKKNYKLKRGIISNPDISSIINSDEIQSIVRDQKKTTRNHYLQKHNPLKNKTLMDKLNPFQATLRTQKKKKIKKDKSKTSSFKTKAKEFFDKVSESISQRQNQDIADYNEAIEITKLK